ncbi:uncharacterized protein Dyak_GE23476, isoform C [Drosophila yakuba]|uniref:Uncharacterized protein, isoform C n=1 Tax=Drosophila yakuba TaxID=7245 RepID=A0A0R1DM68_DROYA|nr:uncharacterized protein Dyak_GE23476, isoform C [Drosophila yakuba]
MRTKHLILILIGVIIATIVFIAFGPAGEPNDSFKNIVVQTHQQFKEFQKIPQALSIRLHSDYPYFILSFVRSKQALLIAYSHRFNVAPPLACRVMQLNCS